METHQNQIMITLKSDGYECYCQTRVLITDPSKLSLLDDGLSYKYQRTA